MNHQPNPPTPDAGAINELVKRAVHSHRIKLRVLTTTAFVFGFIAIATSIFIVTFYLIQYLPKQRELLYGSQLAVERAKTGADSAENGVRRTDSFPSTEVFISTEVIFTHVVSIGLTLVAFAVGALGLGTLSLLTVVVLNRRVAFNQINESLAQISKQLRELKTVPGGS